MIECPRRAPFCHKAIGVGQIVDVDIGIEIEALPNVAGFPGLFDGLEDRWNLDATAVTIDKRGRSTIAWIPSAPARRTKFSVSIRQVRVKPPKKENGSSSSKA
jgi:hypothetical protein